MKTNKSVNGGILVNIWKNVILHFLYLLVALISLLNLVHFLTACKNLMPLQFFKRMILKRRTTAQLVYLHSSLMSLESWFINNYEMIQKVFEFSTQWFWKGAQYPTCFIQITSILAKRVKSKRICGYNFNGFIKSIGLHTTRTSNHTGLVMI